MTTASVTIFTEIGGDIANVHCHPTKASALHAMALEDGFEDFRDWCKSRNTKEAVMWKRFNIRVEEVFEDAN